MDKEHEDRLFKVIDVLTEDELFVLLLWERQIDGPRTLKGVSLELQRDHVRALLRCELAERALHELRDLAGPRPRFLVLQGTRCPSAIESYLEKRIEHGEKYAALLHESLCDSLREVAAEAVEGLARGHMQNYLIDAMQARAMWVKLAEAEKPES